MTSNLFSVVICTRNSERYLERCLESLKYQSYTNYELVIQDCKSTDKTLEIIRSFQFKDLVIKSHLDNGIYDAFNRAISNCTGEYICFLHSDDFYPNENVLQDMATAIENSNCDMLYSDLAIFSKKDSRLLRFWSAGKFKPRNLLLGWMPPHPTTVIKREMYAVYGGYDANFTISGDYELLIRMLKDVNYRTEYLPKCTYHMDSGGTSNGSVRKYLRRSREDYLAIQKHLALPLGVLFLKQARKVKQIFSRYFHDYR